jgi:hypothetical protein
MSIAIHHPCCMLREIELMMLIDQVKNRALSWSHVMQYGDLGLNAQNLSLFMGSSDPANDSATVGGTDNSLRQLSSAMHQRDADLLYFWHKVGISLI